MEDHDKTKEELIRELFRLRSKLDAAEAQLVQSSNLDQLMALTSAAESLIGIHELPLLWPRVKTAVQNTLKANRLAIYLYDSQTDSLTCPYAFGFAESYLNWLNKTLQGAPGSTLLYTLAPVAVENINHEPMLTQWQHVLLEEGVQAMSVFPITDSRGTTTGALALYWDKVRPLTQSDISPGHALAHMVALALNNIALFSQAHQSMLREKRLSEISRILNTTPNLPSLLSSIVKLVADLIGADGGLLGLVIDRDIMTFYPHNVPNWMNLRPAPRPRGLAWEIVISGEPLFLKDYPSHPQAMKKWVDAGLTRFIGVPLRAGEHNLGMLALFNLNRSHHEFEQRDLDLVESVGRQAGTAIQNLRLLAETQQRASAMAAALNRQAELDKMKNEFTQSVSHELRSPLGIIYGHAELLASQSLGTLNEDQRESSEIIMKRVLMLTDLVDDLTALLAAETQELRREDINIVAFVNSLMVEYGVQARELGITLTAEIEEPVPWIRGDETHIHRVFDNLIANAFKFTPANGRVVLRLKSSKEAVCIQVEDSGEGISGDQLGRIFERFYQVEGGSKRRHRGTGLGLALVKEIVEAHRGTVEVKSRPGFGTTFTIMIPGFLPAQRHQDKA